MDHALLELCLKHHLLSRLTLCENFNLYPCAIPLWNRLQNFLQRLRCTQDIAFLAFSTLSDAYATTQLHPSLDVLLQTAAFVRHAMTKVKVQLLDLLHVIFFVQLFYLLIHTVLQKGSFKAQKLLVFYNVRHLDLQNDRLCLLSVFFDLVLFFLRTARFPASVVTLCTRI